MPRLDLNADHADGIHAPTPSSNGNPLVTLIPQFFQNKSQMDYYKGIADDQNKQIKSIMLGSDLESFEADGLVAKCTVSTRDEFDEVRLLELVKNLPVPGLIKTREYVDMDVLESAIYNGVIPAADLLSAQVSKEIVTLKVSKAKAPKAE